MTGSAQFPEVESFVEESVSHYSLDAVEISGMGIREALCRLKQSHPQFKAVMMGTRSTDPFSGIGCVCVLYLAYIDVGHVLSMCHHSSCTEAIDTIPTSVCRAT